MDNKLYLAAITSLMLLSGCQSLSVPDKEPVPLALLQPCEPLKELEGITGADMIRNITTNSAIYHSCADSKKALIEAVKDK